MYKKIYFSSKPLFLVSEISKEIEDYLHRSDAIYIDEFSAHAVKTMIFEMGLPNIYAGVFLYKDVEQLLNAFKKELTVVQAAGGLVHTDTKKVLMIFRKGRWDLPKGKLDENESLELCAIREIKEETGLDKVRIEKPLCVTYHTYRERGLHILKESHWFLMKSKEQEMLQPQLEEDIEKCEWVSLDELGPYLNNTHASIADVINAATKMLHELKSS